MKMMIWTCDRCGAISGPVLPDDVPPNWTRLHRDGRDPLDLCRDCQYAFGQWSSPAGLNMDAEILHLRPKVGKLPLTVQGAGYAECPDCVTIVQVIPSAGGFTLRHVLHRT